MRSLHCDWSALEFLPALYKLQELLSWQLIYSSPLNLMNVHPTCVHLVFSSRLNLCRFLELFLYTATSALVVCHTNSSCLRLSEFDLCLLSSVGLPYSNGASPSLLPCSRKYLQEERWSFLVRFTSFVALALGIPALHCLLSDVWRHKFHVFCPIFLVAYNCQASQQLQSILLWGRECFQLLKHTCFLTVFLHISLLFYGYINILGMLIRILFMSFLFLELVVFHWGKFPLLSQFGHYFCPNSQWVLVDW